MKLFENLRKKHDEKKKQEQQRIENERLLAQTKERDKLIENNADYTQMKGTYNKETYRLFSTHFLLYQYEALWKSLGEKEWWLADNITEYIMQYCLLAARDHIPLCDRIGELHPFIINEFNLLPYLDLLTLDRLWCQHSNGMYGFSVQYRIFCEVNRDFNKFCRRIWLFFREQPAGYYPSWMNYYTGGILLEDRPPVKKTITNTERTKVNPGEVYEYVSDQDWYEDPYAGGRSETKKFAGYKDGWKYDQAQKDWYQLTDTETYDHGDNLDPYRGYLALFSVLEKYGITDPEKSLYRQA